MSAHSRSHVREDARRRSAAQRRDDQRMAAIETYRLLDRRARPELDVLVSLAADACRVPMASINIITRTSQHSVATVGFEGRVVPREVSMCGQVFEERGPVVVPDASVDERFADSPWVTGDAHIRFYATHQLVTPDGVSIGTLCVFDTRPREIDEDQRALLASLARRVVDVLELDLRSRRLAETGARLRRSQEELRRSNELLAAFAGQVSHDLRNPLVAVRGQVELIRELARSQEDLDLELLRHLADKASGGTERMLETVRGVLEYASVDSRLALEDVDLAALVREVREDLGPALAAAEVVVGDLPTVRGDLVQLRVLLQNLLVNAASFVREGEPTRITLGATPTDAGWRVCVADTGRGVRESARARIFEPFVRDLATAGVPGTGLGLATCARVVEAHRGRIGVEETPGGGATFWFELPA